MTKIRFALIASLLALSGPPAFAQSNPGYVRLGLAKGALYKPDAGQAPHVGVIVLHRTSNYLSHPACTELSRRGFMVLCMNSRFDNNETLVRFETIALDVKEGVGFLRAQAGITKVVLFGHSGGGATLSFYQAVAENGPSYCQGAGKLTPCGDELAGLPRADGIVFADAHPGEPVQIMRGLNPSIVDDGASGTHVVAALDPFGPANGYNPHGASHYAAEFRARYFAAQAKRMNDLIDYAQQRLSREAKDGYFSDNDVLVIRGGGNPGAGDAGRAFLFVMDPSIAELRTSLRPHQLLKNDGTVETRIIESVKVATPDQAEANRTFDRGTKIYTLRSFLSSNAMRATNSLDGIDFCSSNNAAACAVQSISAPLLITTMGAHDFVRDDEKMYESAKSADKEFVTIEGALHGFTPCKACETTPGQYSNTMKNEFDYVAGWIGRRF
jgi:pimeloyl-ACP methyl ester carboxylesterase